MDKVPLVKGLSESRAKAKLDRFGFESHVRYSGDGDCLGMVTAQSPVAGELAEEGSSVTIEVPREACESPTPTPSPSPTPSPVPV
jgi:serine/threonine-protein kinase